MSKSSKAAEQYGFSKSFFDSDPALKSLLAKAVKGNWTPDKFTASFRNTKWFQTHGSTYRQNLLTKTSDPASYKASLAQWTSTINDAARKAGAVLTSSQLSKLADHALMFGYTTNQINDSLGSYVKQVNGQYTGDAATNAQALQSAAWRNGVKMTDGSIQSWVRKIESGDATTDDFTDYARTQAASLAPGLAAQLKGGQDLYDLASPYISSMASTLELNQGDIDLFDPTIRGALNSKDADGKPQTQTLGDFEKALKQDPRWDKTQNAQDSFTSTAHGLLQSFGFVS